jgi:hypothetical protein
MSSWFPQAWVFLCSFALVASGQYAPHNYMTRSVSPEIQAALKQVLAARPDAVQGNACDAVPFTAGTIVASADYSGRGFCNTVLWIALGQPARELQAFDAWSVEDVSQIIQHLGQDGVPDLVIPVDWSLPLGTFCTAIKFEIYRCETATCADVSRQLQDFYKEKRAAYAESIARLTASPTGPDAWTMPCLLMQRDWVDRHFSADRRAGFALAEEWLARNDDEQENLRMKAIAILFDIGDQPSVDELKRLASGKDKLLAAIAQEDLRVLALKKGGG